MIPVPESLIERPDEVSGPLSFLRTHGEVLCRSEFDAPWSVGFGERAAHVHLVERGRMLVCADGCAPIEVVQGSLVFLGPQTAYTIASQSGLAPIAIDELLVEGLVDGRVLRHGGNGARTELICAQFTLDGMIATRVAAHLPQFFVVTPEQSATHAWMAETARLIVDEVRRPRLGSGLMVVRLLDLLLVQLLRVWAEPDPMRLRWLAGLDDQQIGHALAAMHADPAQPWNLERLAMIAGLGRTAFAQRFHAVVGETPLRYLAQFRLHRGAELLRAGAPRVGDVATRVGYGSEAAFTRAFRAQFGVSPGTMRRRRS
jgi:AraC-like DNA-binding protein